MAANPQILRNPNLAIEHHVIADGTIASDGNPRHKETTLTHYHIVPNVYMAIELCTRSYNSISRNPFVHGTVRPDFYIVFQDDPTGRAPFSVSFRCALKVKSIGAYRSTRLYDYPLPDTGVLLYGHICMDMAILTNDYMWPYHDMRLYHCAGVDVRPGMYHLPQCFKGPELQGKLVVRFEGLCAKEQRLPLWRSYPLVEYDKGSSRR